MVKKKELKEKPYPITISDWIIHLNNKSLTNTNYLIFVGTVVIAVIIGIIAKEQSSYIMLPTVVLIFVVFRIFEYILRKKAIEPCNKLMERIIRGELTEPKEILEEYKKIPKLKL